MEDHALGTSRQAAHHRRRQPVDRPRVGHVPLEREDQVDVGPVVELPAPPLAQGEHRQRGRFGFLQLGHHAGHDRVGQVGEQPPPLEDVDGPRQVLGRHPGEDGPAPPHQVVVVRPEQPGGVAGELAEQLAAAPGQMGEAPGDDGIAQGVETGVGRLQEVDEP